MRSQLVDWGRVWNLEELFQRTLGTRFQVEGDARPPQPVDLLVVDAGGTSTVEDGSRSDQVYRFSMRDPRIACVRGHLAATRVAAKPIVSRRITYKPPNGASPYDVILNLLDVNYFKDVLSRRLHERVDGQQDSDLWQESSAIDEEYCRQMVAEHRVIIREGRKLRATWQPLSKGLPNHFWDCAVYQCAAAEMIRVDALGPYTPPREQPKDHTEERRQLLKSERKIRAEMRTPSGHSYLANRRGK
jgi:phage terminase large subunit GpA-like protein